MLSAKICGSEFFLSTTKGGEGGEDQRLTSIREICDNLDHLWYQNYDLHKERGENMDDNVYRPTICGSEAYLHGLWCVIYTDCV